jgi:ATP-dependent Zn protease
MVAEYGMGKETYNMTLSEESYVRKESQYLARKMDDEMMNLVEQGRKRSIDIITKNKEVLKKLADLLL